MVTRNDASEYPYPPSNGKTHYPGCWRDRGHHNCAVAEVDRLWETVATMVNLTDMGYGKRAARIGRDVLLSRKDEEADDE